MNWTYLAGRPSGYLLSHFLHFPFLSELVLPTVYSTQLEVFRSSFCRIVISIQVPEHVLLHLLDWMWPLRATAPSDQSALWQIAILAKHELQRLLNSGYVPNLARAFQCRRWVFDSVLGHQLVRLSGLPSVRLYFCTRRSQPHSASDKAPAP